MPERLDAFMARANAAYYATHDPFADFTTAPEITQVFGEILGLWAAIVWQQIGSPAQVTLAELGPGRGTLMRDATRAITQAAPAFAAAAKIHLVETSPRLRAAQAALIPGAIWHDRAEDVPKGPIILLANEFLDALPIRQFVQRGKDWTERQVQNGTFTEIPCPSPLPSREGLGVGARKEEKEPQIHEINEPAQTLIAHLATRLKTHPGAALFLDYGPKKSAPGDSLQALRNRRPTNPLEDPGTADLTAHVDFQALAETAQKSGATPHGPIPQGPFLAALGLFQRTGRLARTQPPTRAAALIDAAQRLAEPDRMGGLFKALCLCQPGQPIPPGFE